MNKYYQPLGKTVNGEAKRFLKRTFVDWYSYQVSNQLSEGQPLESMQVPTKLSIIKRIQDDWLVEFYNYIISTEGKKHICCRWRAFGNTDAIQMGKTILPPIDPVNDLEPLIISTQETEEFDSVIAILEEQNGLKYNSEDEYDESSNDDLEWEYDERSGFDAFIVDE